MKLRFQNLIKRNLCIKVNKRFWFLAIILLQLSCTQKLQKLEFKEGNYELTSENDLENDETLEVINTFFSNGEEGYFTGVDSIPIFYKEFKQAKINEKGAILISSGRTEAAIKYKELIFDLYNLGYSVFIHDHRGQGFSGRLTKEYELGYVEDFQDYIVDMKTFYDTKIAIHEFENIYLIAHSMGGAIGLSYLEQFQSDFTAAAFSSPMLGLSFMKCPLGETFNNNKAEYAPTQANYEKSKETFKTNTLTNSKIRYGIFRKTFDENPKARLGGISLKWLNESCLQFNYMIKNLDKLKTPSVLYSGEEESIVAPESHIEFVEKAGNLNVPLTGYFVKDAKHELLIEKDMVRTSVLTSILDFFEEQRN